MPNRYVRESAIESEHVDRLSWAAEVFWRRLLNRADDFGRFTANPELLRASLFPLRVNKVSAADIGKWLSECETADLVSTWKGNDGKHYLVMHRWEKGRAKSSKYPEPPDAVCKRMREHVNICEQASTDSLDSDPDPDPDPDPDLRQIFEVFRKKFPGTKKGSEVEWANFRKKHGKSAADIAPLLLPALEKEIANKAALQDIGAFCPEWAHLSTWINQSRWTQELPPVNGRPHGHAQPPRKAEYIP